jgi:TolB-like protein
MNTCVYQIGLFSLIPDRELLSGRDVVPLNRKALAVLSVLAEAEGSLVTKQELMDAVWPGNIVEENTLHVHINAIRSALNDEARRLVTVYGLGYRLMLDHIEAFSPAGQAPHSAVAVLPFVNLTGDDELDPFGDGIAEELINQLTQIPRLRVPAHTSCFAYKGHETDARQIAHDLGVSAFVEGSVRKSGDHLRVTAQLVNADDGFHLWSENYDRKMGDFLDLEDDIVHLIVNNVTKMLAVPNETE